MSRLAKKTLVIPLGVNVSMKEGIVTFQGSQGTISQNFDPILVSVELNSEILVNRVNDTKMAKAKQGLYWTLFRNHLQGVSSGFEKKLELQGVGYRWEIKGAVLVCTVGFSHLVEFQIPEGVTLEQPVPNTIVVKGYDKQQVGQVAANIRMIKPPEPYKGKGIRYSGEVILLKEGKSSGKK